MIKRLLYIFIPVFAVLLMSHNVSAVDMSPNVHPIWANANPLCSFYNGASHTWVNNSFSNNSDTQNVTYSIGKINCDYPAQLSTKNTYAVYSFRIDNFNYNDSSDSGILSIKADTSQDAAKFGVIGVTVSAMGSTGYQFDVYLYGQAANSNGGTIHLYNNLNTDEIFYLKPKERVTFVGASYWQVDANTDFEYNYTDVLNSIDSNLNTSKVHLQRIRENVIDINDKLDNLGQDTADAINNGQADATQDAADNSSSAGSSSSSDATSATSSLLSVIGAGIGAITTASPTNCRINGDMGNLDIGNIDLCANPVPTFIAVIGSIIAVLVVLPLVIVLFNRFISIIRSFQG